MTQAAKSQEPSMEEILASIRRIIADDDATKAPPKPAEPAKAAAPAPAPARPAPPRPAAVAPVPPPPAETNGQDDIDAMFASVDTTPDEPAPPAPTDILELTEEMEAAAEPPPALRRIDATPDVVYNEAPAPVPTVEAARRQFREQTGPERSLLSSSTTAAVDSAFNSLAHTVLVQNSRTLDDLVREMLRPMLKAWLDDNLPNMVERLVRAEIERVSRGRG
jgi:cell pole-organizing protein PopZ